MHPRPACCSASSPAAAICTDQPLTRVTTSDQVLILLREQLQRIGKGRASRASRSGSSDKAGNQPMIRLRALAGRDGLSEEEFRRTFVRALLAEQLGERVALDPGFQQVVDDVYRIVSDDAEATGLMSRALDRLRDGGS